MPVLQQIAVIGTVLYVFRRQLFLCSENPREAERQGLSVKKWDFIFYASFGLVVTIVCLFGLTVAVISLAVRMKLIGTNGGDKDVDLETALGNITGDQGNSGVA